MWACALVLAWSSLAAPAALAQDAGLPPDPPPPLPSEPLFDDSVLHDVQFQIHSADWAALQANFRDNTYYPCAFVWRGQVVRNVGIRSRGTGTRDEFKPGLRVDFDRYSTDQEFLGLKSLVLDNLLQDASGLKERLAMKLFQRLGIPAPREAHARLFVNNTYIGVYAIVESIDKGFMRRLENLDADGFLFEYRWKDDWWFTPRGPTFDPYQAVFSPVTHEKDAPSVLYSPIEAFVRVANTSTDFAREVVQYLDPLQFLTYLAAELFVAESDGFTGSFGVNNFYLYKKPKQNEFKFIPWDRDNTFHVLGYPIDQNFSQNALTRRLLEVPEWRAHYFNALLETAKSADARDGEPGPGGTPPATWLQLEIERQYLLIRDAMLQDRNTRYRADEFEAAINALRDFARERGRFVTSEVARLRSGSSADSAR
jgi:hypothetical protein